MRLWRKSGPPEPAVAHSAAAGVRDGSAQDRFKGDAQETARQRLVIASAIFSLIFLAVALRMSYVSLLREGGEPTERVAARGGSIQSERADIVDRNGVVLATSVPVESAFVNPRLVLDPQEAARKIVAALPELKYQELRERLDADKSFLWIKRGLSPREQDLVNRLGIPGLDFQAEERRIYPQGSSAAHVMGYASVDNIGLAGIERFFDPQLQSGETLQLSIDLRLQRMVEQELVRAVQKFSAIGATGIVMDATNGEILAMASLPTFDPNKSKTITNEALFNRATLGVYEQGSTFKIFNTAMALDSGKATVASTYDAREPIKIDRFTINDDHPQYRIMTVAEIFKYSSNIGSAKMALEQGPEAQRAFFEKIGFLKTEPIQLSEVGSPLYPRHWAKINSMTIAFGHGISVSPIHLVTGAAAMVNGGILYPPTLLKRNANSDPGRRVIQAKTSLSMRQLLRLNVVEGTGKYANVAGYEVGGKTGTAEKVAAHGGYRQKALISSFIGMFPMNDPKFVVLVSLDEPKGIAETSGYATGGMVAAPSVKTLIENIVSLYGILPGDWNAGLVPLEISSVPVPASVPTPRFMSVSARHRLQEQHKGQPVRAGGQTAAAPGVRPVVSE